jgi:primosomal protein N' (replication factor Y)
MFYYSVWVRSQRYHGKEPLTYSFDKRLAIGSLVEVELQSHKVIGFISGLTTEPRFKIKPIITALDLPPLPLSSLKLLDWISSYYPAPLGLITQQLLPAEVKVSDKDLVGVGELTSPSTKSLPKLNDEQQAALDQIQDKPDTYLLHGRTGSGKTRLYIELALKATEDNRSAIILTPEISLTSQLAANFKEVFGNRVLLMHSKQTPKERRLSWMECLTSSSPRIVIGPRSALFAPLKDLGLVVIDEAHESAYKQTGAPQYQSVRIASTLTKLTRSTLVLGSATPLVTDYYLAEQKKKPILKLNKLAKAGDAKPLQITVVDRKDHEQFKASPYISQSLVEAISRTLHNGNQALLYLNRRGTARLVMCENCGWQATCPHCGLPLTYHGDTHLMRCHSCNYKAASRVSCPDCGSPNIVFKTAGTKAIASDVERLFPEAKVARFDTDNTKSESFEQNYEIARSGRIDILVGTQMIAKGLDLPRLSLVGILLADTSLYIPDFTSDERTFQLINQVLGRVGRGHVDGEAVIQTYHPDHPILKYAVSSDYKAFYDSELASRRTFLFPPFCYLLKLTVRRASIASAESAAEQLKETLSSSKYKVIIEGPAPSFYEKANGKYEWQLIVKSKHRGELIKVIDNLPANWLYDIDPVDLL